MMWQDLVITIAIIVFSLALIPQVYHGFKERKGVVKLMTSAPTAIGLFAISIAYFSLSLYFSTILSLVAGMLWLLLFLQGLIYKD